MNTQKILDAFPVPVFLAFFAFACLPSWETAAVIAFSFLYSAFQKWLQETRHQEIEDLRLELKLIRDRLDVLAIGKHLHR